MPSLQDLILGESPTLSLVSIALSTALVPGPSGVQSPGPFALHPSMTADQRSGHPCGRQSGAGGLE